MLLQHTLEQTRQIHALVVVMTQFDDSKFSHSAQFNPLMTSYTKNNQPHCALDIHAYLRIMDNEVDYFMVSAVLKACNLMDAEMGKVIHAYATRNLEKMGVHLATAFIHMYAKSENLAYSCTVDMYGKRWEIKNAEAVLDSVKNKDVMIWSAMIVAYSQPHCLDQAFDVFVKTRNKGVRPNQVTMATMLSLCAETGAMIWRNGFILS
ncbi:hypothetical protein F3Y22_tig00111834pilonHSYRG00001 [Hibiscus syriacus]|uniref:Pentatricopeptide repeat-containing protein n=1 Tax=Hibiscus syriacus TaxID=106335 RepID=A0A6A2YC76_HIBSY|nr:hypothetical protein F3Y22_tig00111834pilonHSYRG00001 [Hibiscus syriacus]